MNTYNTELYRFEVKRMKTQELKHHGIKGQKWGKKNGPPYPLDDDDHSASERKAGWKSSLKSKLKLTDKQKKYLKIGATVAVAGLAAYGAYKYSPSISKIYNDLNIFSKDTRFHESLAYRVKDITIVDPENKLPKGDLKGKAKESLNNINISGESDHCQQNSIVACLKYMGVNVDTKEGMWSTSPGSIVDKCFKGNFESKVKEPNIIMDSAEKASDWIIKRMKPEEGSCGTISCKLANGNDGHAIRWIYEEGKIKFSDPWARTPTGHRVVEDASFYFDPKFNLFTGEHPCISRIDNLELNYDEFYKYFKNA